MIKIDSKKVVSNLDVVYLIKEYGRKHIMFYGEADPGTNKSVLMHIDENQQHSLDDNYKITLSFSNGPGSHNEERRHYYISDLNTLIYRDIFKVILINISITDKVDAIQLVREHPVEKEKISFNLITSNIYFNWGWQEFGFGQLSVYFDDGKITVANECMTRSTVRELLHAYADYIADHAHLDDGLKPLKEIPK